MTKICDVKLKIKNLNIKIDKTITIQVLNSINLSFIKFFDILNHKARIKKKLSIFESFAKLLKNQKL